MKNNRDLPSEHPDILIGFLQSVDNKDIEDLESFLRDNLSKNITSRENSTTLQASLEWALPALLIVYLSKSFIDSFLKEIGSETGKKFYRYLTALIKRQKNKEAVWMNSKEIKAIAEQLDKGIQENKIHKSGNYSPVLSFDISFSKSHRVKIVVPFFVTKLSERKIQEIISEVHSIISIENNLGKYLHKSRVVIYGYDLEDNKWIEDPVRYSKSKSKKAE